MVIIRFSDIHKALCTAVFMGVFCNVGFAQQTLPDTLQLDEIEVVATRIYQPLKHQPTDIEFIDSTRLSMLWDEHIGQILASESPLFIKENGPGALSNASQRGLSSEQIQVLWEGIPINNVMVGQTDLSLLPAAFFSDIQVSSGTPSSAFGGGSLSGVLYLSSDWKGGSGISLQQSVGSYGQWQTMLNAEYHSSDWRIAVRSSLDRAENDYPYYNRAYDRNEYREHNRTEKEHVMATVERRMDAASLQSTFWFSNSANQLPGTILSTNNRARQEDRSFRWLSKYSTGLGSADLTVKNYLDRVDLDYLDPATHTQSLSTYRRWMLSAHLSAPISNDIIWKGELSGALTGVKSSNYTSARGRRQFSALTNPEIALFKQHVRIYPALRLDMYSDFGAVLSPSLGINYEVLSDLLFVRGQLSRDFNPPTFNALYWGQAGNAALEAERSNSAEAGLTITPGGAGFSSIRLTGFFSRIDEGIRWFPDDDGAYRPENVEQVTTQGIEGRFKNQVVLPGNFRLELQQSASLTHTQISEPRFPGDAAVGNQMRYVPEWKYRASLSVRKGIASGLLQYRRVGRRYVTDNEDLANSLDPYQVVDATFQLQKEFKGFDLVARGGIRNVFDEDYEVIQWYAMPQRNYTFSLTTTYNF